MCLLLTYVLFVFAIHFKRFVPTRPATQQTPDATSLLHTTGHRPEEQKEKEEEAEEKETTYMKKTKNKKRKNNKSFP